MNLCTHTQECELFWVPHSLSMMHKWLFLCTTINEFLNGQHWIMNTRWFLMYTDDEEWFCTQQNYISTMGRQVFTICFCLLFGYFVYKTLIWTTKFKDKPMYPTFCMNLLIFRIQNVNHRLGDLFFVYKILVWGCGLIFCIQNVTFFLADLFSVYEMLVWFNTLIFCIQNVNQCVCHLFFVYKILVWLYGLILCIQNISLALWTYF